MRYNIHGSGVNLQISNSALDVFVNGAILRCLNQEVSNSVITSGILQTDAELLRLPPMFGQNKEDSFALRKAKLNALQDKKIQNLTIILSDNIPDFNMSLLENINASNVNIVTIKELYRVILSRFGFLLLKRKKFLLLFTYIIAALGIRRPRANLRPSTGVSAGILFYNKTNIAPMFTGVGGSKSAYYRALNESVPFNMLHDDIDEMFLEMFYEFQ